MKTFKLFSMAALALMMAACSSEDNEIQQPAQQGPITFTATLAAPNSGATNRTTATQDGFNYNVAWKEGDKIALVYEVSGNRYKDEATVTAVDGSGNATISGTLSVSVAGGEDVTLVYPYDVVKSADEDFGKAYEPNTTYFNGQTGAAPTDATNGLPKFDWREGSGTFSVSGTSVTLSSNVTMASNTAIWKLNLTSDGTTPLVSHTVSLNCPIPVSMAAFPDDVSEFYLYVPIPLYNFYNARYGKPIEIQAESGGKFYSYTHSFVTLTAGKIYESNNVTLAYLNEFEVSGGGQSFTIYYYTGESWTQAIDNHAFKNAGWMISGGCVLFTTGYEIYLLQDNHSTNISPTATIDKTVTYKWTSFL